VREVLGTLREWYDAGTPFALATVVEVRKSAPRQAGAVMALDASGAVLGSVSGGCVEGAVYDVAQQVLASGHPRLETYGISDDDAFAVGLTCGGIISVFVERVSGDEVPQLSGVLTALASRAPVAVATAVGGPARGKLAVWPDRVDGTLGRGGLDAAVTDDARGLLAQGLTEMRHYGPNGERRQDAVSVFVESFAPPPRLYVFGAIDYAAAVARIGAFLGYHVVVCDARPVFATAARFPDAAEVVVGWPHRFLADAPVDERSVICVLTHDPKFDVPLLEVALRTPAAYVGAMGSRRTHEDRLARLRERGLSDTELARLCSPIGLDLGARTPEETAVSVAAELIQRRWGGSGVPLSQTRGAIHPRPPEPAPPEPAPPAPTSPRSSAPEPSPPDGRPGRAYGHGPAGFGDGTGSPVRSARSSRISS
jgi:xanthine dehydrogenase accessory factor